MLVALSGILGCGKSSVARALAELGACCFIEPEEDAYPPFVKDGGSKDAFGTHMWFRSSRVHNLLKAHELSLSGQLAVVDSIYDKMLSYYLGEPGFEWIMSPADSYFSILRELSHLDAQQLPALDLVVFLKVDKPVWEKRIKSRARDRDASDNIREMFHMEELMEEASRRVAEKDSARLVIFDTNELNVDQVAQAVNMEIRSLFEKGHLA